MTRHLFKRLASVLMILAVSVIGLQAFAQNRTVSGSVADQTGQPVIGAAIVVAGNPSLGTVTDIDGKFTLSVPAGAKLNVTYLGFVPETVTVGTQTTFAIVLQEDSKSLEETVVIGYGVQKKSDLTGSIASLRASDIKNVSVTDAGAALQGKVSGVQIVNSSGAPGEAAKIRVRGYSSNSGNIGPLLIVDGLKVDNIQYLDPSMIESMEVLKDAASAAIYGAEAGNGVILITTKKGAKGTAHISYDIKMTNQRLGKKAELFGAPEYIEYQKAIGMLSDDMLRANGYNGGDYNWFDAVFAPSWSQQHNFTFQGGNDKGSFFTALNYLKNDGIVVGDKDTYNRLSAQINADYNLFKWFTIGTNNSIEKWATKSVSQSSYGSMLNSVMSLDPLTPAYYSTIEECPLPMQQHYATDPTTIMRDPNHNNDFYGTSKFLQESTANPLIQRDRTDASNTGINLRGSLYGTLAPVKGLTITSRFGYRITQSQSHSYSAPYFATEMAKSTDYSISSGINTGYYYQWENFANYQNTFGKHSINAMVGMSYIENNWDNSSISSQGADILKSYEPNFRYIDYLKADATKNVSNAPGKSASMSYFGRIGYSYDNRYSIQANFRADAFDSSKLSAQKRWGYFPSVSAAWTLSNESFIKENVDPSALSFLKIRGSWGQNGNVNILNNYPYAATIALNGQWYQYNPSTGDGRLTYGSGPTDMANPDLKWETSEQFDLGLDARFLNDRLSFGFDWYRKTTKDQLIQITPVAEIGVKSAYINAGNVLNTGFEIELGWRDNIDDFSYGITANISTLHNEVLSVHKTIDRIEQEPVSGLNNKIRSCFEAGQPIWYFRGWKYAGVDKESGKPTYYDKNGEVVETVTDNDKQYIGKAIPDATYGITLNFGYKGFDLNIFGSGQFGNSIVNMMYSADRPATNTMTYYWRNSWKQAGDNAKFANAATVAGDWNYWSSSACVFDGSFFKIKQIQLGYTLPKHISKSFLVDNLRVFVSLDDFITFSSYPGCDPETATTGNYYAMGYDCGTYPTTKKLILGANITF